MLQRFSLIQGELGRIRTPNLLIRSQVLYPVELLVRKATANLIISSQLQNPFLGTELVNLN